MIPTGDKIKRDKIKRDKKMKRKIISLTVFLALFLICGCMKLGIDMIGAPTMSRIIQKMNHIKSYKLAREGLPGDILMATAVTELSPNNAILLKDCAYIYFAYGLFVEEEDIEYAKELFIAGKAYGMRALKQNQAFRKGLEKGLPIQKLVHSLGPEYAEALCWTSLNTGLWVLQNLDDPSVFIEMPDILAMAKQSIKLDDDYFHGVVKAFLGCYYAMVPKALDPDAGPENSQIMFDAARKVDGGNMLLIDLFEARFLAANINDEKQFDSLLNHILETDSSVLENGILFNELAKAKAQYYLDHKTLFF